MIHSPKPTALSAVKICFVFSLIMIRGDERTDTKGENYDHRDCGSSW